jgi:hypothetical protein
MATLSIAGLAQCGLRLACVIRVQAGIDHEPVDKVIDHGGNAVDTAEPGPVGPSRRCPARR